MPGGIALHSAKVAKCLAASHKPPLYFFTKHLRGAHCVAELPATVRLKMRLTRVGQNVVLLNVLVIAFALAPGRCFDNVSEIIVSGSFYRKTTHFS